jgi:hypothetical protein
MNYGLIISVLLMMISVLLIMISVLLIFISIFYKNIIFFTEILGPIMLQYFL